MKGVAQIVVSGVPDRRLFRGSGVDILSGSFFLRILSVVEECGVFLNTWRNVLIGFWMMSDSL
jgi:hypothetical protein